MLPTLLFYYQFERSLDNVVAKYTEIINQSHAGYLNFIHQFYDQAKLRTSFLSEVPPIKGIGRALKNNGIDPVDGTEIKVWINRLNQIFVSYLSNSPDTFQIRLIEASDSAREVTRVIRTGNKVTIAEDSQLESMQSYDFYYNTMDNLPNAVHISAITLNKTLGKIELPKRETFRTSKTVTNEQGEVYGVLVINTLAEKLLKLIDPTPTQDLTQWTTNAAGQYLIHPQPGKAFAHELSQEAMTWRQDFETSPTEKNFASPQNLYQHTNLQLLRSRDGVDWLVWSRVLVNSEVDSHGGIILHSGLPMDRIRASQWQETKNFLYVDIAITTFFIIFLSYFLLTQKPNSLQTGSERSLTYSQIGILPKLAKGGQNIGEIFVGFAIVLFWWAILSLSIGKPIQQPFIIMFIPVIVSVFFLRLIGGLAATFFSVLAAWELTLSSWSNFLQPSIYWFAAICFLLTGSVLSFLAEYSQQKSEKLLKRITDEQAVFYQSSLENVLNSGITAICIFDKNNIILFANDAARKIFGEKVRIGFPINFYKEKQKDGFIEWRLPEGTLQFFKFDERAIIWNGKVEKRMTFRDSTRAVVAQKAIEEANNNKTEFLSIMSHEIRSPLAAALGMIELLGSTKLSSEQKEYLSGAQASARQLFKVLGDVLDISKIESGALEVENVIFNLSHSLQSVGSMFEPDAVARGIDFEISIPPELEQVFVKGDLNHFKQILINLIINAIKFTLNGGILVKLDKIAETSDSLSISVSVRDTGIGITQSNLEKLFKPFAQSDSSITRRFGGTGLGLTISKRLAEAMGGNIKVESQEGQGSTFSVFLSFEKAEEGVTEADISTSRPPLGALDLDIILVDDSPITRKVAEIMLTQSGARVRTAASAKEALALYDEYIPDLMITDLQMPEISGFDLTNQIRIREGEQRHTKIMALTAHAQKEERQKCIDAGMNGYCVKPFTKESLITEIFAVFHK